MEIFLETLNMKIPLDRITLNCAKKFELNQLANFRSHNILKLK